MKPEDKGIPVSGKEEKVDKSRRRFLYVTGGIAVAWLGAAAYPIYRYIAPRPAPDPFGEEGRAVVKKISPAEVLAPGTGANGSYGQRGCIVFRTAEGELRAFDSKCTHAGCNVNFAGDKISCHCHGGVYDFEGRNVAGPPPRPLTPLRVFEEGGVLYVAPAESTEEVAS
jgi:Rieske Fe-S protein